MAFIGEAVTIAWSRSLLISASLVVGSCQRSIEVQPMRIVSPAELSSLLPAQFEENEGVAGKLVGVLIAIDGVNLQRLAGGSRNPIVRYVTCADGRDVGYSFGPFVGRDYVPSYLRENRVRSDMTYTLVATALPTIHLRKGVCVQLDARSYIGLVARSERLPLPAQ